MVPDSLSKVKPFITKASELKDIDSVVSYYCKLYAVEIILTEQLHLQSQESAAYAEALLDEVEKAKDGLDDAMVNDKCISYDHVEKFGVAVFNRGFLDIQNNSISQRTVSTLRASVDFLQLLKLWNDGILSKDVTDKIRYAKYHSINIVKKLRGGEDPNEKSELYSKGDSSDDGIMPKEPQPNDELEKFEKELEEFNEEQKSGKSDTPELADADFPSRGDIESVEEAGSEEGPDAEVEKAARPITESPVQYETPDADPDIIMQCQKLCKFAISALNYEDVANAKVQLEKALKMLQDA